MPTGDPSPWAQSWPQGWGRAAPSPAATSSGESLLRERRSCICLWMSSCSLHICSCSSLITFRTDCRKEERGEKGTQGQSALTRGSSLGKQNRRTEVCSGAPGGSLSMTTWSLQRNQKMRCFPSPAPSAGLSCNLKPPAPWQCLRAILGSIITCPHPRYRVQQWQRWAYIGTHPVYTHQRPPQTYQHLSTWDTRHTTRSRVLNPKHSLTPNTTPDSSEASTTFWPFMSTSEKYCNF